jgi:hypothetical protein
MELHAFWLVASITLAAALVFAFKARVSDTPWRDEHRRLCASQQKDDWLVCGAVWLDLLCEKTDSGQIAAVIGIAALSCLGMRTFARLRCLGRLDIRPGS